MKPIEDAARDKWMTPGQAARELGISVRWLSQLCDQGKLIAEKTVLGRLIDPQSVAKLKEKRAAQ